MKFKLPTVSKIFLSLFSFIFCLTLIIAIEIYIIAEKQVTESREIYAADFKKANNCYIEPSRISSETDIRIYESLVNECLSLLPSHIRPYIEKEWEIVFTPYIPEFALKYTFGIDVNASAAATVPHIKTIFVFSKDPQYIPYVLTHEFGHALAYEYGGLDYSPSFLSLYSLYLNSYTEQSPYAVPGYAISSPFEFFASAMATYVTDPVWLESEAPDVAEHMKDVLKETPYNNFLERTRVAAMRLWRVWTFREGEMI